MFSLGCFNPGFSTLKIAVKTLVQVSRSFPGSSNEGDGAWSDRAGIQLCQQLRNNFGNTVGEPQAVPL